MVTAALVFATPPWLLALPVLALGAYFLLRASRRRAEQKIRLFVSTSLAKEALAPLSSRPRRWRFYLPVAIIALLILAAARPLSGPRPDHGERKGVDFVIALDVSKSMWASDVAPNRLAAIKKELSEWLKTMAGDRVGLVVFAGSAVIQAPITFDYQALNRVLQEASPKAISKGGTNIAESIDMATTLMKKSGVDTKALVIITDGENLDGDAIAAARKAHDQDGLSIFTVGVGSPAGSKIPVTDPNGKDQKPSRNFMRNEYGTEVVTHLDERSLKGVAAAGGGQYELFQPNQQFFPRFRDSHLLSLSKNRKILNVQDYYEWFQLPVALAIFLIMLEPWLSRWQRSGPAPGVGVPVTLPKAAPQQAVIPVHVSGKAGRPKVAASIILFFLLAGSLQADPLQDKVQALFAAKKPDEAIALMKQQADKEPDNPLTLYNYGLTLYQAQRYEDAITAFQTISAIPSTDESLRAQALLQLGNAQYRLGNKLGNQPAAALSMERALAFYDQFLTLKSSSDGKHNRDATVEKLETILRSIANDRLKAADELPKDSPRLSPTLKEASDALDRMLSLDPTNKDLAREVAQVHQRLADALLGDANRMSAETDKMEAAVKDPKQDRQIIDHRNQAIDIAKQAQTHSPNDQHIQEAIEREQNKIADFLTKRTEERVRPILSKPDTNGKELNDLSKAHDDLTAALEAAPNHEKAKALKAETDKRMEDENVRKGEAGLASAEKNTNPRTQLTAANMASESFKKAQEANPDSAPAKAGLEKLQDLLPKYHAAVAALDMADARKFLGAEGSSPDPNVSNAKPDDLRKAVGSLETAAQNYGRAAEMAPDNANFQKGLAEAQQLLSESRDALDKRRQADAAATGQPQNPGENKDSAGSADGPAAPNTQVYAPRRESGPPPAVTSGAFWKKTRDW